MTREFEELVNRLFDVDPFTVSRWPVGGYDIPADIFASEDKVVVRLELAGVDAEDLDVSFHDDALVVTGLRRFGWDSDEVRFLRRGIFYGEFTRHIPQPQGLNRDRVEAHFEDGILELTSRLPRRSSPGGSRSVRAGRRSPAKRVEGPPSGGPSVEGPSFYWEERAPPSSLVLIGRPATS